MTSADDLPHVLFVYGTLKHGEPYHHLFDGWGGNSQFLGNAITESKWPLVVATTVNAPFMLYEEGRGHQISGELYRMDDEMLKQCDDFESCPEMLTREKISVIMTNEQDPCATSPTSSETVQLSGSIDGASATTRQCWCYVMKKLITPILRGLPPTPAYSNRLTPFDPNGDFFKDGENETAETSWYLRTRQLEHRQSR